MKSRLILASFICVAISGYFLTTTAAPPAAQTTGVRSNGLSHETHVQPDLPGLVAEILSQGLAMKGLEVYRDGEWLTLYSDDQVVEIGLPSTLDGLKGGEFTAFVDGTAAYVHGKPLPGGPQAVGLDCLGLAFEILGAELEICTNLDDDNFNAYCLVEAAGNFATNTLKCLF